MTDDSRRPRLLLAAFAVLGGLSAAMAIPSASAEVQGGFLTPAEVSAYETTITHARNTQSDLGHRTTCLSDQDQQMAIMRDDREKTLGELRQKIDQLNASNNQLEQEYTDYKKNINSAQSEFIKYKNEFDSLQSVINQRQQSLDECRKYAWFFCDIGYGIAELFDSSKKYSDQMEEIGRTLDRLNQEMKETGEHLQQSGTALSAARDEAEGVKTSIGETEEAIKALKLTLSRLREEEQMLRIMLDQFDLELEEARNLAPEDSRARTARAIRDITVKVDGAMTRTTEVIVHAKAVLPPSIADRCLVQ